MLIFPLGANKYQHGQDEGRRGSKNVCFCPHSGYKTVHAGKGGQKWQNSVHVDVECPLGLHVKNNAEEFKLKMIVMEAGPAK